MKKLLLITLAVASLSIQAWSSERSPNASVSCSYTAGDIGTVVGYGSNIHKARSQASEMCFDRRVDLIERETGDVISDHRGGLVINSCVNIRCQ